MPRSHAVNRGRQQEEKERKDAEKATGKRRKEHRKAHSLVWVQWAKESLSPLTTQRTRAATTAWSGRSWRRG
jgi:hypothetical protein